MLFPTKKIIINLKRNTISNNYMGGGHGKKPST
jgi:hypothetical protein